MQHFLKQVMAAIFSLILLSACSSVKDDLKTFMKCGMAASQLQKEKASSTISKKLEEYGKKYNIKGSARDAMFLKAEIEDELRLHERSTIGLLYIFVKIYNSSVCQDIHEQDTINMPLIYYLTYFFL